MADANDTEIVVRKMAFMHVPKCGGMSIHAALKSALPPGSLAPQRFDTSIFCDFSDYDLLDPVTRSEIAVTEGERRSLDNYTAVCGHFSFKTLAEIVDPRSIATIVREPRSRLLSLYTYWRVPEIYERWNPYRPDMHARRPFVEFLKEPLLASAIDNQICRMLLHGDRRLPGSAFARHADIDSIAMDAIQRLDSLGSVCVLEFGNRTWYGLERVFGVKLEPLKLNVTTEGRATPIRPGEALLTDETLDLLEQRNAADLLVYDHLLARAGANTRERQRITQSAFVQQLAKFGDLVGHSGHGR